MKLFLILNITSHRNNGAHGEVGKWDSLYYYDSHSHRTCTILY